MQKFIYITIEEDTSGKTNNKSHIKSVAPFQTQAAALLLAQNLAYEESLIISTEKHEVGKELNGTEFMSRETEIYVSDRAFAQILADIDEAKDICKMTVSPSNEKQRSRLSRLATRLQEEEYN